jgi:replicative DNA helicase Mcm
LNFAEDLALDWNQFFHDYYYSTGQEKIWDKNNDIFSALVSGKKRIIIDYNAIMKYDEENNTNLASFLNNGFSEEALHKLEKELNFEQDIDIPDLKKRYRYSLKKWNHPTPTSETDPVPFTNYKLKMGFSNVPKEVSLYESSNKENWGKLVKIKGTIQNIGVPTVFLKRKTFFCSKCHWSYQEDYSLLQKKYFFVSRQFCPYCRANQQFQEGEDDVFERIQLVVLSEEQLSSSLPLTLKCIIPEDLIDEEDPEKRRLLMGKQIDLVGILDSANIPKHIKFIPILNVLYWETKDDEIQLSDDDLKMITDISHTDDLIGNLVKSYCPSVFGYEKVKEALLLSCVGGVEKTNPKDKKFDRGSIHVLLIGCPATSKTTLAKFITNNKFPRSKYAVASSSSQAGLGLAMVKDPETENWMVSAGVLPLASGSSAIIDEYDKTDKENLYNLDSVMENQVLNVNKAGLSISLPAKTTVIAIANPKMSRWDKFTDLKDQIEISEVSLSRFDIKFAFDDVPDEELDGKICDMMVGEFETKDIPIQSDNLIKYLIYAKRLKPKISKDSIATLKTYYVKLRTSSSSKNGVLQITPRQFGSLIRLTEAYAKLRLAEETTKEDSDMAINMFEYYLQTFALDESGQIDIDKAEGRTSKISRNKYFRMLEIMKNLQDVMGIVPEKDFKEECMKEGFTDTDITKWLEGSMSEGKVLEPKPKLYKVI